MDALGRSFLAAAKSNDVAAMERYRSRQGDIHVATTDGCSALMMAALYRSEEAVEWCLQVSGPASAAREPSCWSSLVTITVTGGHRCLRAHVCGVHACIGACVTLLLLEQWCPLLAVACPFSPMCQCDV